MSEVNDQVSENENKYFVMYDLEGKRDQAVGPYSAEDANYHANDIRGFVGILNVRIVPADAVRS